MSAWSWVARIGGYAAAPFTGGASIPIGEAVAQGISANEATNKQNEQLQAGNQAAMDVYSKTLQPTVDRGNAAGSTLAMMMGLPSGGSQPASEPGAAPPLPISQGATTRTKPPEVPAVGIAQQRGTLASLGMGPARSSYRTVRMRSPDGLEEQDVPEQAARFLEAEGAVRV